MDERQNKLPGNGLIAATAEHNANFEENIRAIIRSGKPASVIRDDLDNYHANDIAGGSGNTGHLRPGNASTIFSGNDGRDFHPSR